ncbi:MAG: glycerophosphodiester phosphodiesterase [Candidatus Brocadiaceae bacterium]|nr:glycerophosphodiester phosphodiesterase [Candidatus Brocadiaceae bacterium]
MIRCCGRNKIKYLLFSIFIFATNTYGAELIAHRAVVGSGFKENTLEAISNSWKFGADAVELDIRMSKDGVIYLFHDKTINGTTVDSYNYSEMLKFDNTITKLSSVLNLGTPDGYYILDLKNNSRDFLENLISLIQISGFTHQKLIFQSSDIEELTRIKKYLPNSRYAFLSKLKRKLPCYRKPSSSEIIETLVSNNIMIASLKGRQFIDNVFINDFRQKGIKILVWNINDLQRVKYYTNLGVDGIITDRLLRIRPN